MSSFDPSPQNILYHYQYHCKIIRRACIRCEIIYNNEKELASVLPNEDDVFVFRTRRTVYNSFTPVQENVPTTHTQPEKKMMSAASLLEGSPSGIIENAVDYVNDQLGVFVVGKIDM
jgi:hypothetical protein